MYEGLAQSVREFGAWVAHGTEWLVEPLEPEIMSEARGVALRGAESSEAASYAVSRKPFGLRQTHVPKAPNLRTIHTTADCQNTLIAACEAMRKAKYSSPVLATLNMSQT